MTYALGQPVTLTWAPGVATTAALAVVQPDGTTLTPAPTVTGTGTGPFSATWTPTQPGRHTVRWTGTGAAVAASPPDVVEVLPAVAGSLVSLADLRKHLGWPTTKDASEDADLLDTAASATSTIESELGRPLRRATFTRIYRGGPGALVLPQVPCSCPVCAPCRSLTVTSVTRDGTALAASDYDVDDLGILTLVSGASWSGRRIVVSWAAGYTVTPPWASLAVKRLVEHLWGRGRGARHSRTADSTGEGAPSALAYLLPYQVQSLIEPHAADGIA